MTPRQRIFSLPASMPVEEASARIVDEQHSRIPIFTPRTAGAYRWRGLFSKDVSRLMHFDSPRQ